MNEAIRNYLLAVAASAMLLSLVQAILPKGSVRKVAGFVGGLLVILAVLSPAVELEFDDLTRSMNEILEEAKAVESNAVIIDQALMSDIIKQQCQTYIWDKANALGAELEVEVTLGGEEVYPYPVSVVLEGKATPEQKMQLSEYISRDMGIPVQEQEWKIN